MQNSSHFATLPTYKVSCSRLHGVISVLGHICLYTYFLVYTYRNDVLPVEQFVKRLRNDSQVISRILLSKMCVCHLIRYTVYCLQIIH